MNVKYQLKSKGAIHRQNGDKLFIAVKNSAALNYIQILISSIITAIISNFCRLLFLLGCLSDRKF